MTPEQFDRWQDFALRMARNYPGATAARRKKIETSIEDFFSWYERDDEAVAQMIDWDNAPSYVGDRVCDHLQPHQHYRLVGRTGEELERANRFATQVSCCIRAGIDRASSPSAGVVGFTVGDLRRMYPDGLPDWVIDGYEPPVAADTPDDAGIWL